MENKPKSRILTLILGVLVLLAISVYINFFNEEKTEEVINQDSKVIVSESIMKSAVSTGDDQFWASMYRQDPISKEIYFVVDRNKNELLKIDNADHDTFRVRTTGDGRTFSFATDKNGVYCNDKIQPNISPESFTHVNRFSSYVKDAKNVYYSCDPIYNADPATFVELGIQTLYAKDANQVYYSGSVLKNADPKTFNLIETAEKLSFDASRVYRKEKLVGGYGYKINSKSNGKIISVGYPSHQFFEENGKYNLLNEFNINSNLFVHRNKIYYINNDFGISVFNPENNSIASLNLNISLKDDRQRPKIVNFYIQDEDLYLLYGQNCNDYREKCNLDLLKFNMRTLEKETLLTNVRARNIFGFDEEKGQLYIYWAEGDGGCSWMNIDIVEPAQKKIISSHDIGMCSDDADYEMKVKNKDLLIAPVKNDITRTDGVYIQNGKIVPPPAGIQGSDVFYINN